MGVLKSGGYDVKSVNPTDMRGNVNQFQESMIETAVTQHAICLVNGLEKVDSFLDNDLSLMVVFYHRTSDFKLGFVVTLLDRLFMILLPFVCLL